MSKIYYDKDVDINFLKEEKIAIIGFGNQGHAQAMNLKDNGHDIIVGLRQNSKNIIKARKYNIKVYSIEEAVRISDIIMMLIPDENQAYAYKKYIEPNLRKGKMLMFSHGFSILYSQIKPPKNIDVTMVAPKGQGHMLRREFQKGNGLPGVLAIHQDYTGNAKEIAAAYAKGIGITRVGLLESSFKEETESDLFSEQAVICGGLTSLMKAGFETLVNAGFQPELAYFECVNEIKLIADLIYKRGLACTREVISNTAEYGDYISQEKIITKDSKKNMKKILKDIQTGKFAKNWIKENESGNSFMKKMRKKEREHSVEKTYKELIKKMPWTKSINKY